MYITLLGVRICNLKLVVGLGSEGGGVGRYIQHTSENIASFL